MASAKGIFYRTDILDSVGTGACVEQVSKSSGRFGGAGTLTRQQLIIEDSAGVHMNRLETLTFRGLSQQELEGVKGDIKTESEFTHKHINISKFISVKTEESPAEFHAELLYEAAGEPLLGSRRDVDEILNLTTQSASALEFAHRENSRGSLSPERMRMFNGILKVDGLSPVPNKLAPSGEMVPPRVTAAVKAESAEKTDVYAWAMTMCQICIADMVEPWDGETVYSEYVEGVKKRMGKSGCAELLAKCLDYDPEKRPTFGEILRELENALEQRKKQREAEEEGKQKEAQTLDPAQKPSVCVVTIKGQPRNILPDACFSTSAFRSHSCLVMQNITLLELDAIVEKIVDRAPVISLDLGSNKLGLEGAVRISKAVSSSRSLRTISICENAIGDAGTKLLCAAIVQSRVVDTLDICKQV